jgi:hypothetical protein
MKAMNLPKRQPTNVRVISREYAERQIKAKYIPRAPKDGEAMVWLERPQMSSGEFAEFARGDLIRAKDVSYVVVAAKPGFTRSAEGWKRWEQILVVRPATEEDEAAVAEQRAAQSAESQRSVSRIMD